MARYVWVGRSRDGGDERGVVRAPTRDAALKLVQSRGVLVTRLEQTPDSETVPDTSSPSCELSAPPRVARRDGESLRDRFFYIGVALFFAALGMGTSAVAPLLRYECERDASGSVNCVVHRRMYGLLPLPDWRLSNILAAETESSSGTFDASFRRYMGGGNRLVLVCADGTRWKSVNSSSPIGSPNEDLASGIGALRAAGTPRAFRAWQGEKLPLLVGTVFLAPAALVAFAFVLRLVLPHALVERKIAELERVAARRRSR